MCPSGPITSSTDIVFLSLFFHQICEKQKTLGSGFKRYWVDEIKAPYAVFQTNQWLGYDDLQSIQAKVIVLTSDFGKRILYYTP